MTKDPDVLKYEIDELQNRVKERAGRIGEEISPRKLAGDALDKAFGDPSETFARTTRTIANHPVAASLATAGILSLAGAYLRETRSDEIGRLSRKARKAYDDTAESVWNSVSGATEELASSARSAADKAREAVVTGRKQAEEAYETASREAGKKAAAVAGQSKQAAQSAKSFASENPLAAGLIAVAAGAALASVFAVRSARKSEDEEEMTPATRKAASTPARAKPRVTQAKKSTRAKSTPNKVTKSMKPAKKATDAKTGPKRKSTTRKKPASTASAGTSASNAGPATGSKLASGNGVISTH